MLRATRLAGDKRVPMLLHLFFAQEALGADASSAHEVFARAARSHSERYAQAKFSLPAPSALDR